MQQPIGSWAAPRESRSHLRRQRRRRRPLTLLRYNRSIPPELGACIPPRGAAGEDALCLLVGNSRAVWDHFLDACVSQDLLRLDNPLEAYLETAVCGALAACAPG